MVYCVLSEPCVYISCYYGNAQGAAGAEDFGARVPDSHSTLSNHRFGTTCTTGPMVGGRRGKDKSYFHHDSLNDSDSVQVSCCFQPGRIYSINMQCTWHHKIT